MSNYYSVDLIHPINESMLDTFYDEKQTFELTDEGKHYTESSILLNIEDNCINGVGEVTEHGILFNDKKNKFSICIPWTNIRMYTCSS